jgi:hypothetical protein
MRSHKELERHPRAKANGNRSSVPTLKFAAAGEPQGRDISSLFSVAC